MRVRTPSTTTAGSRRTWRPSSTSRGSSAGAVAAAVRSRSSIVTPGRTAPSPTAISRPPDAERGFLARRSDRFLEPLHVQQDATPAPNRDQPLPREGGQRTGDQFADRSDPGRDLLARAWQDEIDSARSRMARAPRFGEQELAEALRDGAQRQIARQRREGADASGHGRDDGQCHLGALPAQRFQLATRQPQQPRRRQRRRRGYVARAVEERHLTERGPGPLGMEHLLAPARRQARDLDPSLGDEPQPVARIALAEDRRAFAEAARPESPGERGALLP